MKKRCLILCLCLILALTGCIEAPEPVEDISTQQNITAFPIDTDKNPTSTVTSNPPVSEPIYNSERPKGEMPDIDLKVLYLTVFEGDTEETAHTWKEINTYSAEDYANMGVKRYKVAGTLYEGTEEGITDDEGMLCTVSYRGQASSRAPQKSYKIKLTDEKWMDQKVINLNKHYPDKTRYLNKLVYDIIDEIPQLIGLKTQFVRLYVKDLSGGADPNSAEYVDYGLFTHVEQLNGRAIKRLNLDKEGSLYKVNGFEFWEYNDVRLTTDPEYNEKNFELRLENKGTTDNEKLIALMDAVNKGEVSDQELLDYYVEKENIAYWMAFQILIDNIDTNCRNFYLYSPSDSQKWYIISWDNDGAFSRISAEVLNKEFVPWRYGVHDYWGNCLFRNLLRTKDFREALVEAATDLKDNYLTEDHLRDLLDCYEETVGYILTDTGDKNYFLPEIQNEIISRIPYSIEENYKRLIDSLNCPTPYFIGGPSYDEEKKEIYLAWNESYDFEGRKLSYIVEVTDDPSFEKVLFSTETEDTRITFAHEWGAGRYYVRVSSKNSDGYMMRALTTSWAEGFGNVYGAQTYTIE